MTLAAIATFSEPRIIGHLADIVSAGLLVVNGLSEAHKAISFAALVHGQVKKKLGVGHYCIECGSKLKWNNKFQYWHCEKCRKVASH